MTKRVLLVKLTSMGDLIHALPAITDATTQIPDLTLDWVIDESFSEVATWHPGVNTLIKSAHRRWRKNLWQVIKNGEIKAFFKALRRSEYDVVIDGQTNIKSAIVTTLTKGPKHGLNRQSAREKGAEIAYRFKHDISKKHHAVERLRALFAASLGYEKPNTDADFGIDYKKLSKPKHIDIPLHYVFFTHNASWDSKLWPESYWCELTKLATKAGLTVVLPAGNAEEMARSKRICGDNPRAIALPRLSLSETAAIIQGAKAAVGVDTGLGHLTAALKVPAVNLYGSTSSSLIGALGNNQVNLQAPYDCAPCYKRNCQFAKTHPITPRCFEQYTPELVWHKLQKLMY